MPILGACLCQAVGPCQQGALQPPRTTALLDPWLHPPDLSSLTPYPRPKSEAQNCPKTWSPWTDISIPLPSSSSMQWRNYACFPFVKFLEWGLNYLDQQTGRAELQMPSRHFSEVQMRAGGATVPPLGGTRLLAACGNSLSLTQGQAHRHGQ